MSDAARLSRFRAELSAEGEEPQAEAVILAIEVTGETVVEVGELVAAPEESPEEPAPEGADEPEGEGT